MQQSQPETLGVNVSENVKAVDAFGGGGQLGAQLKAVKGIAATLYMTDLSKAQQTAESAYGISKQEGKPVIIVVRAQ